MSLNQCIAAAVADKVGVIETREFLERRVGGAKPKDLLKYLRKAGREQPAESDRLKVGRTTSVWRLRRKKGITLIDRVAKMSPRLRSIPVHSRGRTRRRSNAGSH